MNIFCSFLRRFLVFCEASINVWNCLVSAVQSSIDMDSTVKGLLRLRSGLEPSMGREDLQRPPENHLVPIIDLHQGILGLGY